MSHILSNMQQHFIMKLQNQYKKLKNIVLWLLSRKGTFTIKLKKKKKIGGPEGAVWKEKRIVTLISKLAFDFIKFVYFLVRSSGQ